MNKLTLQNLWIGGFFIPTLQNMSGMYKFNKAIEYYAEVHTADWNSFIHTLFMPVTLYGIFLGFPGIFNCTSEGASKMRQLIWGSYIAHYMRINVLGATLTHLLFYYPYKFADEEYKKLGARKAFIKGLICTFSALFIQEYVGHYLGGDGASRPEAVPNAIGYACYYAAFWWTKKLKQ